VNLAFDFRYTLLNADKTTFLINNPERAKDVFDFVSRIHHIKIMINVLKILVITSTINVISKFNFYVRSNSVTLILPEQRVAFS